MNDDDSPRNVRRTARLSRRDFLTLAAGAATAPLLGSTRAGPAPAQTRQNRTRGRASVRSGHNILFIFTDQERYFSKWPSGLVLPAHERLQRKGTTFHNHYCPAVMCSSSRAVMLTGLQTPDTGIFENVSSRWVKNLSTDIPTIGHMLRRAGYYTAYKGKWHLHEDFDTHKADHFFTREMEAYGFSDFVSPGDIIAHTRGGYEFDHLIAGSAISWLRRKGKPLAQANKPWCLFVSLVNPHDVMYFNTDARGQRVQDNGQLLMRAARAPDHDLYKAVWDVELPRTLREPVDAPGRPHAHGEYLKIWRYLLGEIPLEEERWRRFNDYYINCIRAVDGEVANILNELDALGLDERTIVVFTSDHGEQAGAHGLHGKGPFAYRESIHLPFHVVHPDVRPGENCAALTSHIDIVPTLLAMAGVKPERAGELAGRELPGKNLMPLLSNPGAARLHAVRDTVLFTYSGLTTNDSGLIRTISKARAAGRRPAVALLKNRYVPDLKKRGSLRTVFDGRYKFTRYFAPLRHNQPQTVEELYRWNDVELFDLQADPDETVNLAARKGKHRDVILAANTKLNAAIRQEIGVDDGHELPDIPFVDWTVDRTDL